MLLYFLVTYKFWSILCNRDVGTLFKAEVKAEVELEVKVEIKIVEGKVVEVKIAIIASKLFFIHLS